LNLIEEESGKQQPFISSRSPSTLNELKIWNKAKIRYNKQRIKEIKKAFAYRKPIPKVLKK